MSARSQQKTKKNGVMDPGRVVAGLLRYVDAAQATSSARSLIPPPPAFTRSKNWWLWKLIMLATCVLAISWGLAMATRRIKAKAAWRQQQQLKTTTAEASVENAPARNQSDDANALNVTHYGNETAARPTGVENSTSSYTFSSPSGPN